MFEFEFGYLEPKVGYFWADLWKRAQLLWNNTFVTKSNFLGVQCFCFLQVALSKFLQLWFGARGIEFDWKYMQLCLDSNLVLLQHIVTATFIWIWAKQHLSSRMTSCISMILLVTCYKPLILEHLKFILGYNEWMALVVNAIFTLSIAFSGLYTYVSITRLANGISHHKWMKAASTSCCFMYASMQRSST